MAPSEAQKKASNKYNLKNMSTLGCKVKKEEAEAFKKYCEHHGKTSNTMLKDYVFKCIDSLRVIDKDTCPEQDNIISKGQCTGCQHYGGFEMYYDQPCIKCNYGNE